MAFLSVNLATLKSCEPQHMKVSAAGVLSQQFITGIVNKPSQNVKFMAQTYFFVFLEISKSTLKSLASTYAHQLKAHIMCFSNQIFENFLQA
jgi:hypothetical protein